MQNVLITLGDSFTYGEGLTYEYIKNKDLIFISALFKKVKVVVANDCGPMHLAAACGSSVISIFGPTNPQIWFRYKKIKSLCLQEGAPENEWGELRHLKDREWNRWPSSQKLIENFLVFFEKKDNPKFILYS